MKEEIWKDIKGLEGIYQESNLDNVRSVKYMKKIKTIIRRSVCDLHERKENKVQAESRSHTRL